MVYRTVICVLLVGVVGVVLACSLFGQPDGDNEGPPRSTTGAIPSPAQSAPAPYNGPDSIEERILSSAAIVRARLTSTTTEVVTTTVEPWDEDYYVTLKFQFSVSEYLYGSGADTITAYFVGNSGFPTVQDAEDFAPTMASQRDSQFDNRDAVLFLGHDERGLAFSALTQSPNVYLLSFGGPPGHTRYWIDDKYDRRWLPATSATTATPSDSQEFLLEAPAPGITPATITLGDLKTRIAAIVAEINEGDGSEAYKQCLKGKHSLIRHDEWNRRGNPDHTGYKPTWDGAFASGQPAGAEVYNNKHRGISEIVGGIEEKTRLWLDGDDAALFSVNEINHHPFTSLAPRNVTRFDYSVVSVRPIPAGTYEFNYNYGTHIDCGNTLTYALTATVTAPSGTLHELFFDPVAVGTTVTADDTNGLLSPATFTDANGASATIRRIEWQSGKVKLAVTPHTGLAGQVLDFIELDGTVSLSLDVADATVDSANDTLSWSVASQPWEDGDLLMVRIREAR